jgi:hypothetical protein
MQKKDPSVSFTLPQMSPSGCSVHKDKSSFPPAPTHLEQHQHRLPLSKHFTHVEGGQVIWTTPIEDAIISGIWVSHKIETHRLINREDARGWESH